MFKPDLDWVVLSIDSILPETNYISGRFQNKRMLPDGEYYLRLVEIIHDFGFKFKINTVVHRHNKDEILAEFIEQANPLRWKIFKVLSIDNQNQETYCDFEITGDEFSRYLEQNTTLQTKQLIVPEDNEAMSASYLMIDPAGRFFDNSVGRHTYSRSICDTGVLTALSQVNFDFEKYKNRGAVYEW